MNRNLRVMTTGLLLAVLAAAAAAGQERSLGIEESVRLGMGRNSAVSTAELEAAYRQAAKREALWGRAPGLTLSAAYSRLSDRQGDGIELPGAPAALSLVPDTRNRTLLSVETNYPLFAGFRVDADIERQDRLLAQSRADAEDARREIAYVVRQTYWSLVKAEEQQDLVRESGELVRVHLQEVRRLVEQGLSTRNDELAAEMELARTELLAIEAANARRLAELRLANLIGLPLETRIRPTSRPEEVSGDLLDELPEVDALVGAAYGRRADLTAAQARIAAGEAAVRIARSARFPVIALQGNYTFARPNPAILPAEDEWAGTWEIGIGARYRLDAALAAGSRIAQAEARVEQSEEALRALREEIAVDVIGSYLEVEKHSGTLEVLRKIVQQAEENYRTTREKFGAGVAKSSEVLDAEVELFRAEINLAQGKADLALALAGLDRSVGAVHEPEESER